MRFFYTLKKGGWGSYNFSKIGPCWEKSGQAPDCRHVNNDIVKLYLYI